ncbi:hypothetical protein ACIXK0_11410 [Bacteroides fragilis]
MEVISFTDKLAELGLYDSFVDIKNEILENEGFTRINSKFFSSLDNYVRILNFVTDGYEIKAQSYQSLLNHIDKIAHVFLFTGDIDANVSRINNVKTTYEDYKLIIYRPDSLDISYAILKEKAIEAKEIVTYDPMVLMTLLEMYYENYTTQEDKIKELISLYTNGNL